jgi:gamma-aminobutyric acid type B receptor
VNSCALLLANVEAYRARNISDEFSESKYIGFAMVSMLQALLLGLPLAVLVTNNPEARLFTYSGIIFLISMSLLLLIFVPKMIIVVQDKNSKSRERISTSGSNGVRINV